MHDWTPSKLPLSFNVDIFLFFLAEEGWIGPDMLIIGGMHVFGLAICASARGRSSGVASAWSGIRAGQGQCAFHAQANLPRLKLFDTFPKYKPILQPNMIKKETLKELDNKELVPKLTRSAFDRKKSRLDHFLYCLRKRDQLKSDKTSTVSKVLHSEPCPSTFPPGIANYEQMRRPLVPEKALTPDEYEYPYRYYEVSLKRSHARMDKIYKDKLKFLGLTERNHVTWWLVHPFSAQRILEVRHLIDLRLTNEIPIENDQYEPGFEYISNALEDRYSALRAKRLNAVSNVH